DITDSSLTHLSNLETLKIQSLFTTITGSCFRYMPSLRKLFAVLPSIAKNYINRLTTLTELNTIGLMNNDSIKDLINLKKLTIGHEIDDTGIRNLVNLITLDTYNNDKITNAGIAHLTNLT